MKLRDYQEQACEDIARRFLAGDNRVPISLATGLGKTQIFTSFADRWLAENPGRRVLVIAHTDELISQALRRARQVAPRRRIGRVQGQKFNEVHAEIVVSSRQTLASEARRRQLQRVGLIVIDECHHAVRTNTYGRILEHFGAFDEPDASGRHAVHVLGVTATLIRSDKSKLSTVWQDCTFRRDILFGIRHGYLLDVRGERITVPDLDFSNVRVRAGDYSEADIAEELERTFAPEVIARDYARLAVDASGALRKGIAFWPLVDIAHHGAEAFEAQGIPSAVVSGRTPKEERRLILKKFAAGDITVVHNAMVLTEGFDEPTADVVVIARPTKSAGLYQQMVGRVLRPDLTIEPAGRQKALILDVTGVGAQHDLRSLIDLSPERKLRENPDDDGASLLELDEYMQEVEAELDEQRAGSGFIVESEEYRGDTATVAFDPLGRDKVWGQTAGGNYFISAGGVAYVFLCPSIHPESDPGTYDIVMSSKHNYVRDGVKPWAKGTEHTGLPLDMALSWGEELAVDVGGAGTKTLTQRSSRWRRESATQAQLKMAFNLKIAGVKKEVVTASDPENPWAAAEQPDRYASTLTKGQVSEAIDNTYAARRIDPLVRLVTRATESART